MHLKLFAAAGVAAFMTFMLAAADASCCDHEQMSHAKGACCDMPCCAGHEAKAEVKEVALLLPIENDPQLAPAAPVRQATQVWFMRPTFVNGRILQGRYVIEHDNDRMARGEPCTHIYEYDNRVKPVVTFHCTHLERDRTGTPIAVLVTKGERLVLEEYQFAGESASHGVPVR